MELIEIKDMVDDFYGIDISGKSQNKIHADARKLFVFMARRKPYNNRKRKYTYQDIGNMINRNHDTCIYHYEVALQWFEAGDHAFRRDLFVVFDIKEKKPKEVLRLDRIRLAYDDLLMSIPEGMHDEIMQTIKLKIKASKWKSKDKCLVVTSSDGLSENVW